MCNMKVDVIEVPDDQLSAPWLAGVGNHGERVLFVRASCPPRQVADGLLSTMRNCPVLSRLDEVLCKASVPAA